MAAGACHQRSRWGRSIVNREVANPDDLNIRLYLRGHPVGYLVRAQKCVRAEAQEALGR